MFKNLEVKDDTYIIYDSDFTLTINAEYKFWTDVIIDVYEEKSPKLVAKNIALFLIWYDINYSNFQGFYNPLKRAERLNKVVPKYPKYKEEVIEYLKKFSLYL